MKNKGLVFLLLILLLASFFRLWQLDSVPPGLYPDEAINGNEALETLKTGEFKVFYPDNNGREGLFINLIALSFAIFGVSIWSIKIVAATIGILTVLGLYLLTKELFARPNFKETWAGKQSIISPLFTHSNEALALLSSFFLAVSFWHTNFSRIGFRGILVPFILVFGLYFLIKAFRTKKLSDFIFSGIFWGIGFYTYISFRVAVIILAAVLFFKLIEYLKKEKSEISWSWLWKKMYLQDGWWKVNLFLMIIILVALPIGIYFLQNSQDFMGRTLGVSIFSQENPIKSAFLSLISHLGMFNFYGDPNWRHNFAASPMLFWLIGILFLIGFILSIKYLIKSIKIKDCSLFIVHCLLMGWLFVMLLPGVLTFEGIPHALRTIGVIPVVYIFAAMGGLTVYEWLKNIIKKPKLLFALCLLFFVLVSYSEFNKYFYIWAKNPEVEKAFSKNYVAIGNYLNSLPSETKKYVIVNEPGVPLYGISIPAQTPMFIETIKFGQPRSIYLKAEDLNQIKTDQGKTVIVPLYDGRLLDELQEKFPQGKIKEKNGFNVYGIE